MLSLCKAVFTPAELQALKKRLEDGNAPVLICGLSPLHRALAAAAIQTEFFRPVAVITADEAESASFAADAAALSGIEYAVLPARELTFHDIEGVSREWEHRRVNVLDGLKSGACTAVCGSVEAFSLRTISPDVFAASALELSVGDEADVSELAEALVRLGYCRAETVEGVGQFAFRGGIFDVFPPSLSRPVRIEFFGDEIDAIGAFDITTQRRTENLRRVRVTPALELPPDLAGGGREAFADRVGGLLKGLNRSKLAKELLDRIATFTGGRAAEELVFNSITTGAANDIEQATKLARALITRYGMSEEFGMVALETTQNQYLGGDTSLSCAPDTAAKIDEQVVDLVKERYKHACALLSTHMTELHALAKFLNEKETITGDEFMHILSTVGSAG